MFSKNSTRITEIDMSNQQTGNGHWNDSEFVVDNQALGIGTLGKRNANSAEDTRRAGAVALGNHD